MRILLLWAVSLIIANICFAQQPNYVQPSPQAASFLKYRDYPVDLSTGLIDITVQLLTLDLKSYQLPVSANFHASGRKVDMNYSELGLNWKLNAHGVITREIRGVPDNIGSGQAGFMEQSGSYFNTSSADRVGGFQYQKYDRRLQVEGAGPTHLLPADTEYDIYTISFGSISCSFIIRDNNEIVFLDYVPLKITRVNGGFVVTDDTGIQYHFGNLTENGTGYGSLISYHNTQNGGAMSWYLAKIVTPSDDIIRFKYQTRSNDNNTFYGTTALLGDFAQQYGYPGASPNLYERNSHLLTLRVNNTSFNEGNSLAMLTEISSSVGNIVFNYRTSKTFLDNIIFTSTANTIIKKIEFSIENIDDIKTLLTNNQDRTIKEIRIVNPQNSNDFHKYEMEYYTGAIPARSISEYCYGRDYWGYCNTNTHFNIIPVDQVQEMMGSPGYLTNYTRTIGSSARRQPSFSQKVVGMLKKITYPTGGSSEFVYEANRFTVLGGSGSSEEGPGLRIAQVKQFDGSKFLYKNYKYGYNENGAGWLLRKPVDRDFQTTRLVTHIPDGNGLISPANGFRFVTDSYRFRYREFYSDPVSFIRQAYSIPVYYENVVEYQSDATGTNLGKTVYSFSRPNPEIISREFSDSGTQDYFTISKFVPNYHSKARMTSKTIYKSTNNVYSPLHSTSYIYGKKDEVRIMQSTYFRRYDVISYNISSGSTNYEEYIIETDPPGGALHAALEFPWNTIAIRDYELEAAHVTLDSVIALDMSTTPYLKNVTKYKYESAFGIKPSAVEQSDSRGGFSRVRTFYPDDISSAQSLNGGAMGSDDWAAVQSMKRSSGSYLGVPVQTEEYAADGTLSNIRRSGFKVVAGKPQLYMEQDKRGLSDPFRNNFEIQSFGAKGTPLQVKGVGDVSTAYVWDSNGQYPIAVAENAVSSDIAFTGFEGSDMGGWQWTGAQVVQQAMHGRSSLSFASGGGSISKSGLTAGTQYRVSLWIRVADGLNGPGTGFSLVKTVGGWSLYERVISGVGSYTYSNSNCIIDNISLCPVESQMTIYTYLPVTGLCSVTDARGASTYYEYDDFNRLSVVKDDDGFIIKSYCYNYQGDRYDCEGNSR